MQFTKKKIICFLVIIVILVASSVTIYLKIEREEVTPPEPWHKIRLSPYIRPKEYHLWLHPNLSTGLFEGRVTILVNVNSVMSYVAVHTKGLEITESKLSLDNATRAEVQLRHCFEYPENEFWICETVDDIQPNDYRLYFEFKGKLTNKIVGFYRSTYRNAGDEKRHIATTKFEPTYARQAFPCFDEPSFKATYHIQLVKPAGNEYIALSNTPQSDEIENQPALGLTTVVFQPSELMSTYLACFIVCDFDSVEGDPTRHGYPITVYARKEFIQRLTFARKTAVSVSEYLGDYFRVPYPLPKLDLIAIPDFVSGAMENWGLITFREARLLCDERNDAASIQLGVTLTIAHEISHMWFGNLVTMKWWNDLWLNEGFATFMEYKAVANSEPSWDLDCVFMDQELFIVMKVDATLSSHPIIAPVVNPDQITQIFDSISYNKGASVIRMLENTVGEEEFREGIVQYLKTYRLNNAETNDLWSILDKKAPHVDIQSFMDTWTRQMGFPVINVTLDADKKAITFAQERFLSDPTASYDANSSPYKYRWEVPVTYVTSSNPNTVQRAWLKQTDDKITVQLNDSVEWVIVNQRNIGYYLVNYEGWLWKELHNVIVNDMNMLNAGDRSSLIYSAFRLAEADRLSYDTALLMIDYLRQEPHFLPWGVATKEFLSLDKKFYGTDAHASFKKFVRFLIRDHPALSWNIDDHAGYANKTLHTAVIELGCSVENKNCVRQAENLFKVWLNSSGLKLQPDVSHVILYYGVQYTTEVEWNKLWDRFLKEDDPQMKMKMMKALTATKETELISRMLEAGKNESNVRSQDYLSMIASSAMNPTANPIVWDFVRKEWPYLVERYTINDRYLGHLIVHVTYLFSTELRLSQMKEFFEQYPEAGATANARKQALEHVQNNILWRKKHFQLVRDWFVASMEKLPVEKE